MKIVDVAEFYADRGGGVRTYINNKLRVGSEAGHEIVVVAPGPRSGEEARFGGRVVWVKGPPLPLDPRYYVLWREKEVHRILDRERPDVVEGSSPWTGGWFAARWGGSALKAFVFHSDPVAANAQTLLAPPLSPKRVDNLFGWFWAYLRRLSSHFDLTVSANRILSERLRRFGLQRPETIPFGISQSEFSPTRRSEETRSALLHRCGAPQDGKLLVTVSRFHPEKRIPVLIEAFERAASRRPLGMVIYGDGPFRRLVHARARRVACLDLPGFTRDRDELATVLASADAFVHGSGAETYGLAVAEALCSGLPVVVPDTGAAAAFGYPEVSEVYPLGYADGCAEAILRLLDRDTDEMRRACARVAKEHISSVDEHFLRLFSVYGALLEGKSTPQPRA